METNYCSRCSRSFDKNLKFDFCPFCGRKLYAEGMSPELEDLTNCTLGEIFELWKDEHYPLIGEKGREGYQTAWNRLSKLKKYQFRDLKTMHFQKIINEMNNGKMSRSSMEKVKQLASQLCKYAMKNDIVNKNYGALITLPKANKSTRDRFSDNELEILWNHKSDKNVQIILILAYTGFRINELFAIKKANVHLDDRIPYIVGGSKTDAGRNRYIAICDKIFDFVESAYNSDGNYLFTNHAGKPYDICNWRKRQYYPTLEQLGLPKRHIHCLRHTFASMMIKVGADPKSIAQMMGHARFSTTLDIYAHADLEQLSASVNMI